ncbi:MAG: metallophosphoesterase [Victivallales bacterium]|jgi:3',5'-cyclic AMP phosphodiesterase CpdA
MKNWKKVFGLILTAAFLITGAMLRGADGTVFSFAQVCDTQLGMTVFADDQARFERTVELINNSGVDFVVICGDLVNKADDSSYQAFAKTKEKFKVPCYCVPGNHDDLKKMKEFLNCEVPYEVLHKGRAFLFLNSQLWWKQAAPGASVQQDAWLAEKLEKYSKAATPVFIVQHVPPFKAKVDEKDEFSNLPTEKRMELLKLFKEKGVVAVLAGHTPNLGINDYSGIQIVCGETTSKNFDSRPCGFRIWRVKESGPCVLDFVPLEEKGGK